MYAYSCQVAGNLSDRPMETDFLRLLSVRLLFLVLIYTWNYHDLAVINLFSCVGHAEGGSLVVEG